MNNDFSNFKEGLDAFLSVSQQIDKLDFISQLYFVSVMVDVGNKCKQIAKVNNLDIIPFEADDDFTKLKNIKLSFDNKHMDGDLRNGKEQ